MCMIKLKYQKKDPSQWVNLVPRYVNLTAILSATNLMLLMSAFSWTKYLHRQPRSQHPKKKEPIAILTQRREVQVKKHNLLSHRPPVLSNNSGATESSERVAAVTLNLENCSCSQATYSMSIAILPGLN